MIQQGLNYCLMIAGKLKAIAWALFMLVTELAVKLCGYLWRFLGPKIASLVTLGMIMYCGFTAYLTVNNLGSFDNICSISVSYTVGKLGLEREAVNVARAFK